MKYYLKATGSTCYDETGITFPHEIKYDLFNLVWARGATYVKWGKQFGWSNQPRVLTFRCDEPKILEMIKFALSNQKLNLIVSEKTW